MNININNSVYVTGRLSLDGNISLNNAVGAVSDVDLSGGNLNGNNTVIYSKFGDIDISNSQASVNGLIYAPFGTVTIDCDNFNMNGLIIAQNVVIDGYGANINYSSSWAELVGTESEELSWTFDDWQYLADTDEDGLPNLIEKEIGSDPYNPDTDGDGLPDGYEALTLGTDPTKPDTDDNGVLDCDEDFDEDGLTNLQEYEQGTEPYNEDTDGDGLKDGEEINTYGTDPLKVDTDEDGLDDGDEIYFETDPLDPDTNGNGILDGDEKRSQTFVHKVENEDCAVTEVRVTMEGTGNLQKTTSVESIMNKDILCSDVVGLVGEPFSIETTSQFDKATLTYVVDKSKLGDTEFDNLLFLWYDEANDNFVELDTVLDEENFTVSVETTHFSKYMLVDQVEWFEAWRNAPNYFDNDEYVPYDTVITIDCSGSMSSYDPYFNYNYADNFSRRVTYRQLVCEQYAFSMVNDDRVSIVTFSSSAQQRTNLTNNTSEITEAAAKYINNSGGTNFNQAIETSLNILSEQSNDSHNKVIILLSDGYPDSNPDVTLIAKAISRKIPIYTVGLGNSADGILKQIADDTGGEFYKATTAEELENIYHNISYEQYLNTDWDDNDGDKIPDVFEAQGLICSNGNIYFTKYDDKETGQDTDDDGLVDGDEIVIEYGKTHIPHVNSPYADFKSAVYFTYRSDPLDEDTDGDGLMDDEDELPRNVTDPLNPANIESVKLINIPSAHSGQPDFIVSLVKSKMYDDEIFFAHADGVTNTGGFIVSDELIKELKKLENGYQGHFLPTWASTAEGAVHAAKLETDQLVPTYFESGSTAYYGCWAYNMQAEIDLLNYYSKITDQALQAYMVYTTLVMIYQSRMIAAQQEAMEISQQEYLEMYQINNGPLSEPARSNGTLNVGAGSKPMNGAYNIDLENFNPEIGVYQGDATLMEGIADGSQSTIYFENPYNYYPINENSIRVLESNGKMEIIGSPSNKYVNHTPQYCEEFGLNYELSEIQNVGQYTRSNGTVISPETTPTFLHYTVTKP